MSDRVLVTGANGFIGRVLCHRLVGAGYKVSAVVRAYDGDRLTRGVDVIEVGDLTTPIDWRPVLSGINVVIHLAARVHVMKETGTDSSEEYRKMNVQLTSALATHAANEGVRRFIFLSSVGVHGRISMGKPVSESDPLNPHDRYTCSKAEAEDEIRRIASASALDCVIVRPPLVYGCGVKANFLKLLRLVQSRIPLPFAGVQNRRSFLYVENLVDFLLHCIDGPRAGGEVFLVADGSDLSTEELINAISHHMGRSSRLFHIPQRFVRYAAVRCGAEHAYESLFGSLQIDTSKARELLGWKTPFTLFDGLSNTVRWFLDEHRVRKR